MFFDPKLRKYTEKIEAFDDVVNQQPFIDIALSRPKLNPLPYLPPINLFKREYCTSVSMLFYRSLNYIYLQGD